MEKIWNNASIHYANLLIFLPPSRVDVYEYDDCSLYDFENKIPEDPLGKNSPKVAAVLSEGRQIKGLFIDFILFVKL
jgi:hypothetical protein